MIYMEKSGIYALHNNKSGKVYIGQTKDLSRREKDHFRELRKGTHHNKYLQRAYNMESQLFDSLFLNDARWRNWTKGRNTGLVK